MFLALSASTQVCPVYATTRAARARTPSAMTVEGGSLSNVLEAPSLPPATSWEDSDLLAGETPPPQIDGAGVVARTGSDALRGREGAASMGRLVSSCCRQCRADLAELRCRPSGSPGSTIHYRLHLRANRRLFFEHRDDALVRFAWPTGLRETQ